MSAPHTETASIRLLLVEDNLNYLNELLEWLKIFGYQHLDTAHNAAEASQKLDQPYDVIIADMRMEEETSGFTVLAEVQRRNISSMVIILTANETVQDCRQAFKHGATDYISKNWRGNVFEMVHQSIQEAITAFNLRGNIEDKAWLEANMERLRADYLGQYVAVINHGVIEVAETEAAVKQKLADRMLPLFLTVIRKIEPPAAEQLAQLEAELAQSSQPVVFVEGKTDVMILNTAWQKLYGDKPQSFIIKSCDLLPDSHPGGAGGVNTLVKLISSVRADQPHIAIGIFDCDGEGVKGYRGLPNNFLADDPAVEAKISLNRKAAAFLLPIPQGRERYAEYETLCIEYLFSDEILEQAVTEGGSLILKQQTHQRKIGQVTEEFIAEARESRQVSGNKMTFTEQIVPHLAATEFAAFRPIFDKIEQLIAYLQTE